MLGYLCQGDSLLGCLGQGGGMMGCMGQGNDTVCLVHNECEKMKGEMATNIKLTSTYENWSILRVAVLFEQLPWFS